MLVNADALAAVVAPVAPDTVVPSPPATTITTTVLRQAVSAPINRVTSVLVSSIIRPSGRSVCVLVVLFAGMSAPPVRPVDGSRAVRTVVFTPESSECHPLVIAVDAAAAPLFPLTVVFMSVSYTHLRAHETPEHLVCR